MTQLTRGSAADIKDTNPNRASNGTPSSLAAEVDQRRLWNEHHRKYWHSEERSTPTPLAHLLAAQLSPGRRILELGCGSGRDAVHLQSLGHTVTASDFSEFAVRENVHAWRTSGVRFLIQDLRTPLAFPVGAFDAVYARLSLHYFSDSVTRDIFREVHRVLRPGGLILFSCRSIDDPLYGQGEKLGPQLYRSGGQVRHFFSEWYTRQVLSAGPRFTIDDLSRRDELIYSERSSIVQCLAHRGEG
ncbi:class I SAM-dependent methyltransferase [Nonomuraea sp. NPDC004580]|uniref:class I SAM-dependent methyltransferase n=1 Tax=Nonomuraea sp. NPDC004580 TaxID=3154552 RepID=UPI0033A283B2